jgi:Flp pilus assembly protein TadB
MEGWLLLLLLLLLVEFAAALAGVFRFRKRDRKKGALTRLDGEELDKSRIRSEDDERVGDAVQEQDEEAISSSSGGGMRLLLLLLLLLLVLWLSSVSCLFLLLQSRCCFVMLLFCTDFVLGGELVLTGSNRMDATSSEDMLLEGV